MGKRHLTAIVLCAALIVVALLITLVLLPARGAGGRRARLDAVRSGDDRLNVLVVTLDTTRPDRLGCYGYERAVTPAIDALARQGVRFENAKTHVPITLPSHASLFTGTTPVTHGAHNHFDVLADDANHTLAEVLSEESFVTAGFVAAFVLDRGLGIAQGFQYYGDQLGQRHAIGPELTERRAEDVIDEALAWLSEHVDERFFAFIHLYDPHMPYDPPAPFDAEFAGRPYDGEIAYMDSQFGRLMTFLDETGLSEDTLVVVVGDHGESLGEHGIEGHAAFIYWTVTRVPMLMRCPGLLPAGRTVAEQVRLSDVMPTVLDVLGVDAPPAVEGTSLLPYIEGREETPDLPAYIESHNLESTFGWSPLLGVDDGAWKYIRVPEPELYDLARDPGELDNVWESHADVSSELDRRLETFLGGGAGGSAGKTADIDQATIEKLSSLGYVGSPSVADRGAPSPDGESADPKHVWDLYLLYQKALVAGAHSRSAEAAGHLEELHRRIPDNLSVTRLLATHYVASGRSADAIPHLERHLEVYPNDADAALTLGIVLGQLGRHEDAVTVLRGALDSERHAPKVQATLGSVYFSEGEYDRAERAFLRAVEDESADNETLYTALVNLGSLYYSAVGAPERAASCFEGALELHEGSADAHYFMALILSEDPTRRADAGEHARAFLRHAHPGDGRRGRTEQLLTELAASTEGGRQRGRR